VSDEALNAIINAMPMPPRYGPPLTLEQAKKVMNAAELEAQKYGWPLVIALVDSTGYLCMLVKLDHAQLGSVQIAQAKAETALCFRRPTAVFENALAQGGVGLRILATPGVAPLEGGIPLMQGGEVIGAIGVSGMHSSQDALVARAGVAALE